MRNKFVDVNMFEFVILYGLGNIGRLWNAEGGNDSMVIGDAMVSTFYVMDQRVMARSGM